MSARSPHTIATAEDLESLFREALLASDVRMRTREIAPDPTVSDVWDAFVEFCTSSVASPAGAVVEDEIQIESSPVQERLDPTGMHRSPGPYRATWSRRITVANADGDAVRIHEAFFELYFGPEALPVGQTLLVVAGPSAPDELAADPAFDGTLAQLFGLLEAGGAAPLLSMTAILGRLASSELYDWE